jgi:anti-sigma B factor antagonist
MTEFTIRTEDIGEQAKLIALTGEIDLYNAPEFKKRLSDIIDKGTKEVVIDLSEATFIDSTTLGVLVGAVKKLRTQGGRLSLICSNHHITSVFNITGLDRVFPIFATRDEAVANLGGSSLASM